jgi:TolB-like protein
MNRCALCAIVAALFSCAVFGQQKTTIAVLYFDNNSLMQKEAYEPLREGLCDMLITDLSKVSALSVVEREKLDKLMAEIALGQTGVVDESTAPQVGKQLGAQVLVLGGYIRDAGKKIRIDARFVRVETGEVLKAEEITGNADQIFLLVRKLCYKITDQLGARLSDAEKKEIESGGKFSADALCAYAQGLASLDAKDTVAARASFEKAVSLSPGFTKARVMIDAIKEKP